MNGLIFTLLPLVLASHPFSDHPRYKRQFDETHAPQIDLNITVPYIFSARLYPYGISRGDRLLSGASQLVKLHSTLKFLGKSYNKIYVRRDGLITFTNGGNAPSKQLPALDPFIAVYWMPLVGGRVYFRETDEPSVLNLAQNEVNIQYRYGSSLNPTSVVVVTWENVHDTSEKQNDSSKLNSFQIAIIISDGGTFSHMVYSKLNSNSDAMAAFNSGTGVHYALPGSGTNSAIQLSEKSDIGIPGEFLFRIDTDRVHLCGAGFKGLECIDSCDTTEWSLDCSRECHCEGGSQCNAETGVCPNGRCNPGWTGEPICEDDIDECAEQNDICPREQPDCMNTAGAYLCICFEYDNITNICKRSNKTQLSESLPIPVRVLPLQPKLATASHTLTNSVDPSSLVIQSVSTSANSSTRSSSTARSTTTNLSTAAPFLATNSPTRSSTTSVNENLLRTIRFSAITIRPILGSTTAPCRCGGNAECVNGVCQCKSGWTGDGQFCVDINECFGEPSVCGPHSICENSAGSYSCQCDIGYILDNNEKCVDMDECAEGVIVCGDGKNSSVCVNTDGGYECRCASGYTGHPDSEHGCIDVDECKLSDFYCGEKGLCKNLIGSYECLCAEGFQRDAYSGQCVDIDECRYDPCDKSALCSNLYGSFRCTCIDGYIGNGVECRETILYPIEKPTLILERNPNSVIKFTLHNPIKIFGKGYQSIFVSSNGGVSFDTALPTDVENVNLEFPAFFPLNKKFTYGRNGNIYLKLIDEMDAQDYPLLARSSLSVQSKFLMKDFKALSLICISFEKMIELGTDMINSFQIIFSQNENATFVTYLFEEVESESGLSGFSTGSVTHYLPFEMLVNNSNIAERGKWIFRVDTVQPVMCPAGSLQPPLCQKECEAGAWGFDCENQCHCKHDIPCDFATGFCSNAQCADGWVGTNCFEDLDECLIGLHNCTDQADCVNAIGTYRCKSRDSCYDKYQEKCSPNAICDETNSNEPECICNEGYHGDGLTCIKIYTITETTILSEDEIKETDGSIKLPGGVNVDENEIEVTPFVMHNWVTEKVLKNITSTSSRPSQSISKIAIAKDYNEIEDEVYVGGKVVEDADSGSMWFILAPITFCALWAITMAIILAICCRKRRRSTKIKSSLGMTGWRTTESGMSPHFSVHY